MTALMGRGEMWRQSAATARKGRMEACVPRQS